jgi:UDP-3-O-[3-hydroxymyristoyl] glucosamine N-acyltransferase
MGDARFFTRGRLHTLAAIATAAVSTAPRSKKLSAGVASLQPAGPDEVSILDNRRYAAALEQTTASAVIVHPQIQPRVDASAETGRYPVGEARADIGPGCRVGSFVSIGAGVTVGHDDRVGAHASLSHALLGSRAAIYPVPTSVRRAPALPQYPATRSRDSRRRCGTRRQLDDRWQIDP